MSEKKTTGELGSWIEIVQTEIFDLFIHRHIFQEMRKIAKGNKKLPDSYFFFWMWRAYSDSLSMFIRRLIDRRSDVVSLRKILDKLHSKPNVISRKIVVSKWACGSSDPDICAIADKKFSEYVGVGKSYLTRIQIASDISMLEERSTSLKEYIDSKIAHYNRHHKVQPPESAEVDQFLKCVESLLQKYYFLITGNMHNKIDPEGMLIDDWKRVFTVPWIQGSRTKQ